MNQQTTEVKDIKEDLIGFIEKQVLTTEFFDSWWWKDVLFIPFILFYSINLSSLG
jgi:hypothetical protein